MTRNLTRMVGQVFTMLSLFALPFTALAAGDDLPDEAPAAEEQPLIRAAGDSDLSEFLWLNRPVIVFADSPDDPRFVQQMDRLNAGLDDLAERDIVVLTDTDPDAESPLRTLLRPRGFMLVILGKDGGVKLRKPLPWTVREISRAVDKMPIRQQEIRDRRGLP